MSVSTERKNTNTVWTISGNLLALYGNKLNTLLLYDFMS